MTSLSQSSGEAGEHQPSSLPSLSTPYQLVKADLKSRFRQFGAHLVDWRFQVYCNGPNEHYIDIACPFGRTHSTLKFCPCVGLFRKLITMPYDEELLSRPSLGSYGDDIFGGFKHDTRYDTASHLSNYICSQGKRLTIKFNMNVLKTPSPARIQTILGRRYNTYRRRIETDANKVTKHIRKIEQFLGKRSATRSEFEPLVV